MAVAVLATTRIHFSVRFNMPRATYNNDNNALMHCVPPIVPLAPVASSVKYYIPMTSDVIMFMLVNKS